MDERTNAELKELLRGELTISDEGHEDKSDGLERYRQAEPERKKSERPAQPAFNYRRFRASLDLRGASVESVARQASVSSRHVWHVLTERRRGSVALLAVIRKVLGEDGWAFATGETDVLRDDVPEVKS